jgi:hypothetical protein
MLDQIHNHKSCSRVGLSENAKEVESSAIFLKLRAVQELVVIEMVRREFGTGS